MGVVGRGGEGGGWGWREELNMDDSGRDMGMGTEGGVTRALDRVHCS